MVDKNQAMIDFLKTCPALAANPMFFNAINAKDNHTQLITIANEQTLNTPYVDGSVLKRFSVTLIDFKSISYNPIVVLDSYANENVEDALEVQDIIDWITEQAENRNFPDFGANCIIDSMQVTTDNPNLNGIDSSIQPALARYSVTVRIDYIDISKKIWG